MSIIKYFNIVAFCFLCLNLYGQNVISGTHSLNDSLNYYIERKNFDVALFQKNEGVVFTFEIILEKQQSKVKLIKSYFSNQNKVDEHTLQNWVQAFPYDKYVATDAAFLFSIAFVNNETSSSIFNIVQEKIKEKNKQYDKHIILRPILISGNAHRIY